MGDIFPIRIGAHRLPQFETDAPATTASMVVDEPVFDSRTYSDWLTNTGKSCGTTPIHCISTGSASNERIHRRCFSSMFSNASELSFPSVPVSVKKMAEIPASRPEPNARVKNSARISMSSERRKSNSRSMTWWVRKLGVMLCAGINDRRKAIAVATSEGQVRLRRVDPLAPQDGRHHITKTPISERR